MSPELGQAPATRIQAILIVDCHVCRVLAVIMLGNEAM